MDLDFFYSGVFPGAVNFLSNPDSTEGDGEDALAGEDRVADEVQARGDFLGKHAQIMMDARFARNPADIAEVSAREALEGTGARGHLEDRRLGDLRSPLG